MNRDFWMGKRVFLTGHTGFKGGWLALWLADMGAEVHGYALSPPTQPSIFVESDVASLVTNIIGDIRDAGKLLHAMQSAKPEIVLHLAAQSLVRYSYKEPLETFAVNVMGTAHVLEAVRHTPGIKAVINVTTDKCYENREWLWAYRENEAMGGYDPYSSSKGCSELLTSAYRKSFLDFTGVHLATARAGNVIGGGDWAQDRLIPDFLRALDAEKPLVVRCPEAVRPWQHVLEPLSGYLTLAEHLCQHGREFAEAWNFGPDDSDSRSVGWILDFLGQQSQGAGWLCDSAPRPHEAGLLKLDSSKAKSRLGWVPRWSLRDALQKTLEWHREWKSGANVADYTRRQIHDYEASK